MSRILLSGPVRLLDRVDSAGDVVRPKAVSRPCVGTERLQRRFDPGCARAAQRRRSGDSKRCLGCVGGGGNRQPVVADRGDVEAGQPLSTELRPPRTGG